ncbi:4'-phosphopantetheinyl transferase [Streptacidiphilus sp. MAP12-20]|uniref:4'-phosphopantetheinyl transferase family protein n=1 Tax=Streptacidiphilus sp. MAP12-20 TaxID=3156299 RepID=UPI0035112C6E
MSGRTVAPAATPGPVRVWRVDLPTEVLPADWAVLTPNEHRRAEGYQLPTAAAAFVGRRAALRRILGHRLGLPPVRVPLVLGPCPRCGPGPHGVPMVAGNGAPVFSGSSSHRLALVAMADHGPLGVDLEQLREVSPDSVAALRAASTPTEAAYLAGLRGGPLETVFHRLWTRKEAVTKAAGVGIAADLRRLDTSPHRGGPVLVDGGPSGPVAGQWRVDDLPMPEGYVAALARRPDSHDLGIETGPAETAEPAEPTETAEPIRARTTLVRPEKEDCS